MFYVIVLAIAIILLILVLTYVGILMSYNKTTKPPPFPPSSATCPDYWELSNTDASLCVIPPMGTKNTGDIWGPGGTFTLRTADTFGLTGRNVNFMVPAWETTGITSLCAKKKWAKIHNVMWDGVSNTNTC